MHLRLAAILALACLPGCATIIHGTSQNVTVTTNPAGASCRLDRDVVAIGMIAPTPGTLRVDKSKNDIVVTCNREGHDATTVRHASEFGGATFGNAVVGGLIGVAVDAASGANFPYPPEVVMNLQVTGGPPVVQPERPKPGPSPTTSGTVAIQPGTAAPAATQNPAPKP
jgi:hypothetical protein